MQRAIVACLSADFVEGIMLSGGMSCIPLSSEVLPAAAASGRLYIGAFAGNARRFADAVPYFLIFAAAATAPDFLRARSTAASSGGTYRSPSRALM